MNMTKLTILSTALLVSSPLFAQNNQETQKAPAYGDNPNLIKVLAVKTQEKVQNTAERVGAATERGIAKVKPRVNDAWENTKAYTSEQAELAKENTQKGINTASEKVEAVKERVTGGQSGNIPIEKGALSRESQPQYNQMPQVQNQVSTFPVQDSQAPVQMTSQPTTAQTSAPPISQETPQNTTTNVPQNTSAPIQAEGEIARQSIPLPNNSTTPVESVPQSAVVQSTDNTTPTAVNASTNPSQTSTPAASNNNNANPFPDDSDAGVPR